MTNRMMGLETEFGYSVPGCDFDRRRAVLDRIMSLAQKRLAFMPCHNGNGMYLGIGSRLYIDTGGHPEFCTPEVETPWELARYVAANDLILHRLAAEVIAVERVRDVLLYRSNVDYNDLATWGCHENYGHTASKIALPVHLIPHLVSRICITGGGGLNPFRQGVEFLLSPRVCYLDGPSSNNTTGGRGIYNYKDESLSGHGFSRLHVICGEGAMSHRSICLKAGTTALVVALIEGGLFPGNKVQLLSPIEAMRAFNGDPTGRVTVPLASGERLSALEIQRHYLELAEAHLDLAAMPGWAPELCRLWRETLELVERGPAAAERTLDWAIKRPLYLARAQRRNLTPDKLACWNRVLAKFEPQWSDDAETQQLLTSAILLSSHGPYRELVREHEPQLREHGLSWDGVEDVLKLRAELCELETCFSRIGPEGVFNKLDAAGFLSHTLPEVSGESIEAATREPPAHGRGGVRGRLILQLRGQGRFAADWSGIWDFAGRRIDLSNPHINEAPAWESVPRGAGPDFDPVGHLIAEIERRYNRGDYEAALRDLTVLAPMRTQLQRGGLDRMLQLTSWVQIRRGHTTEALCALEELSGRVPMDLTHANDYISTHRFDGLAPRSGPIDAWIRTAEEISTQQPVPASAVSSRFAFLGHKGALLLQARRLDEARVVLEESCQLATRHNPQSRVLARNLCDLGEVHRLLGNLAAAHAALDRAQEIQARQNNDGDFAEFNLPRRAKLATDPRAAKSQLNQARIIQRRLQHTVGMAKTVVLQARMFPSLWHNQRRKRILLAWQRAVPMLRDCPLMGRIMTHWDQWVGEHTAPGEDAFWGM